MRLHVLAAGVLAGVFAVGSFGNAASAAVIVQYNMGNPGSTNSTTIVQPTSSDPNATTNNLAIGGTTTLFTNVGANFYAAPAPNSISIANSSASDDTGAYLEISVTANPGYTLNPTSFALHAGRGGSSNTRSVLLFDDKDGFPTSIAATATTPTVTGGAQVGSTTALVTARSGTATMDSLTFPFTASVANLTSFKVRVYIDTQLNGQAKNVDFGSLTLNGTVDAVSTPEPASLGALALSGLILAKRRRRS